MFGYEFMSYLLILVRFPIVFHFISTALILCGHELVVDALDEMVC